MSKLRLIPVIFTLFSVFMVTSCTTEGLDSNIINQDAQNGGNNGGNNGGGSNTGGNNGGGSTTGSYWPMAVNNKWTYNVSTGGSENVKIISTQTINNKLYYKYDNFFGTTTAGAAGVSQFWTRQQDGTYYARIITDTNNGTHLSPVEYIMLKDNIGVGQTWNQTLVQDVTFDMPGVPPMTMTINVTGKIIEKDITLQVGSQTFNNVIHTEFTQSTMGTTTVTHYYFAKNIGLVKIVMAGGGINQTQSISSYVIN